MEIKKVGGESVSEEKMELVKLLATLRDSFTTAAEAINNYLHVVHVVRRLKPEQLWT